MKPNAITIDFHNTVAQCDEWFELEVRTLPEAFLTWLSRQGSSRFEINGHGDRAREIYREVRLEVQQTGIERDAAECLSILSNELVIDVSREVIDAALVDIFKPALSTTTPMPGAIELVAELHERGHRLAIVSSAAYHPFVEWTLKKFGIADAFQHVITSASCGHYKSSPKIYRIAAASLGADVGDCLHIGDSMRYDVRAAAEVGMKTMYVNWAGSDIAGLTADFVVPDLRTAVEVITRETGIVI